MKAKEIRVLLAAALFCIFVLIASGDIWAEESLVKENRNQVYDDILEGMYRELGQSGSGTVTLWVDDLEFDWDQAAEFINYLRFRYDYTNLVHIGLREVDEEGTWRISLITENGKEMYRRQVETEKSLRLFSETLEGMEDREKVTAIHQWVARDTTYDHTLKAVSCYSNVIERKSTCNGFARAFQAACDYSGIPCSSIRGTAAGLYHIWNRVYLDGQWRYVDATWNNLDQSDRWFLLTAEEMDKDHQALEDQNMVPQ